MLRFHQGGKEPREGRRTVSFTPLDPVGDETEEEYDDLTKPRKVHKNKKTILRMQSVGSILEEHKSKDYNSGRPDLAPLFFMTECQLIAL